jgi:DNA topoisomerase-1
MGIRPGSDTDTKSKVKAFGATTLQGRHVIQRGEEIYLQFVGKKGVPLNFKVEDKELAENLKMRSKNSGENGKLFENVNESSLLDFVHSKINHGNYKTKDFRTLLANEKASKIVADLPIPKNEKEYKKAVMDVAKQVSQHLGNTPIVALQSYISPFVFGGWRNGIA